MTKLQFTSDFYRNCNLCGISPRQGLMLAAIAFQTSKEEPECGTTELAELTGEKNPIIVIQRMGEWLEIRCEINRRNRKAYKMRLAPSGVKMMAKLLGN